MDKPTQTGSGAAALEEELRARNRELAALNDLAVSVGGSLELDETLRVALAKTLELLGVSRGGISLVLRDAGRLVEGLSRGVAADALTGELAAMCVSRGAPVVVPDASGRTDVPAGLEGVGAAAVVPLKSGGRTVGVLTVLHDEPRGFSQHDVSLLMAVANVLGPAVDNAGLFAELTAKVVEVTALNAIVHSISKRLDLNAILNSCLSEMRTLVPFEMASVALRTEEAPDELYVAAVSGPIEEPHLGSVLKASGTILTWVLEEKKTTVLPDLAVCDDSVAQRLLGYGLRCLVVAPLLNEDRVTGTLSVGSTTPGEYSFRQVSIVEGIAGHLSVAVANARLYESVSRRTLELEALARETQHRVQNNLQMIAGLVSMIGTDSEVPRKRVSRCLSQIQAISVIHEMLSCEQDIGEVGLKDSIDRIAKMAAVAACGEKCVSVEVTGENVRLPSRYASAVGIAVNELVANAIEHGFKGQDHGRITIEIVHTNDQTEIVVHDDGVGLPEGFSLEKARGSGLGVLSMLLKQGLGGTLELETKEGTLAKILIRS